MSTKILLADYQRLMREGVRRILEQRSYLQVVAEAGDGVEALRLAAETRPDIAILEIQLPRLAGASLIPRLREECKEIRCIVLSAHCRATAVSEALRVGAAGYVPKTDSGEDLLAAVEAVRSGGLFISPSIAHHVVEAVAGPRCASQKSMGSLTDREREVLQLIAEGLSSKEIASELGVALKTADSHRSSIMEKIGIHKASGLVRFAIREGLVAP